MGELGTEVVWEEGQGQTRPGWGWYRAGPWQEEGRLGWGSGGSVGGLGLVRGEGIIEWMLSQ